MRGFSGARELWLLPESSGFEHASASNLLGALDMGPSMRLGDKMYSVAFLNSHIARNVSTADHSF